MLQRTCLPSLDEMLRHHEFDGRVLAMETEQRKNEIQAREIDLEILKLKQLQCVIIWGIQRLELNARQFHIE